MGLKQANKSVLYIAYHYPLLGSCGVHRSLAFSWQQGLKIMTNQSLTVAENENYLVEALGDVRKYQQDISPINDSVGQLLAALTPDIKDFYHKIS